MASLLSIEVLLYAGIAIYPHCGTATAGNRFSLAFFPDGIKNGSGTEDNFLYMSSSKSGTCFVSYYDGTRKTRGVSLIAGTVVETALPDVTQMYNVGPAVEPKAIYVNCTEDIILHAYNKYTRKISTSEPYLVLPDHALSSQYLVPSVNDSAFIGVVALYGDTHIALNLGSSCPQKYKDKTFGSGDVLNVTLHYGEVFRFGPKRAVQEPNPCDLGGSLVNSNKQIAVFSGSIFYNAFGPLVTQVPPTSAFTKTIIVPGVNRANMILRIVTNNDDTHVKITSELNTQRKQYYKKIDEKEYFDRVFEKGVNVIVSANKPIMVTQRFTHYRYGVSKNEYGYAGRGSLMFIPGTVQYENSFMVKGFYVSGTYFPNVTVITESSATVNLLVDGIVPAHVSWTALSSMPYSVGRLSLQDTHIHIISCSSPMLVRVDVEAGRFQSYSYIAGYRLNPFDAAIAAASSTPRQKPTISSSTMSRQTSTMSTMSRQTATSVTELAKNTTTRGSILSHSGIIVAVVSGVIGFLVLLASLLMVFYFKRMKSQRKKSNGNDAAMIQVANCEMEEPLYDEIPDVKDHRGNTYMYSNPEYQSTEDNIHYGNVHVYVNYI